MNNYIVTIGGAALDDFYKVEAFPGAGDCTHAEVIDKKLGGCVLNCASVMSKLGNAVYQVEYLNESDEGTKVIIDGLNKQNVNTDYIKYDKDIVNCRCMIMECGNEKTIFVIDAKKPFYDVDDKTQELLNNSKYIYSLMQLSHDFFKDINPLKTAKAHGAKIIFDAGCQYNNEYEKEWLFELADGCFLNTMAYSRLAKLCKDEPYKELLNAGLEFICVTEGSKGSTCYTKDKIYKQESMKIKVVDTTGAGDSFAGCFISSLNKGYSYEKALKLATINGAYACSVIGGMAGATNEDTLIKFAKENNFEYND